MRQRLALTVAITLAAAMSAATPADAGAAPAARPTWSMIDTSKDVNDDGVIDGDGGVPKAGALTTAPSAAFVGAGNHRAQPNERLINGSLSWYLNADGFPVRLNACASSGASHRWQIRRAGAIVTTTPWRALGRKTCSTSITLPEGTYDFTLTVRAGGTSASRTIAAQVRNLLVVSFGDSYASGEGNPRNVDAWLADGPPFAPYWDDDGCDRSARAGSAQAALALEKSSPRTSVTFVDVSCSGATVARGLLGPQPDAGRPLSQIEQARGLVGDHPIDIALLSIGGNDVGFGAVLESCALRSNCPLARPPAGVLSSYATVQSGVQATTGRLAGDYSRIAACLGGSDCVLTSGQHVPPLSMAAGSSVLPVTYPDLTRDASGQPCTYLTLTADDFAWAGATILSPNPPATYSYQLTSGRSTQLTQPNGSLNGQVVATSRLPGWHPVTGTWEATGAGSDGHGVCAGDQAWFYGITYLLGFTEASFHLNPRGQAGTAAAILAAMQAQLR